MVPTLAPFIIMRALEHLTMNPGCPEILRRRKPYLLSRDFASTLKTEDAVVSDRRAPAFTLYSWENSLRTCIRNKKNFPVGKSQNETSIYALAEGSRALQFMVDMG